MLEIALDRLTRQFQTTAGVFDVTLRVPAGSVLALVGPSGAGKSTLLRLIAGLETVDSGVVHLGTRDVTHLPPHLRDVGLLAQRPALYPHLDVRRNLSIGLEMSRSASGMSTAEIDRRVSDAIDWLDLGHVLDRRPEQLSGGEQQRVALGRLVVRQAKVWLLDEPFGHLEPAKKGEFRRRLHLLRERVPTTMIVVTHDPVEALTLGDTLAVLDGGRLRQADTPAEVYRCPAHRMVAEFLGFPAMNLADGILVSSAEDGKGLLFAAADGSFRLPVPAELVTRDAEGLPAAVGIRPEDLRAGPASAGNPSMSADRLVLPGWQARWVDFLPPRRLALLERGSLRWSAWVEPDVRPGDMVAVALNPASLHWFDGQTGLRL